MKKHLLGILSMAAVCLSACSDDAAPSVSFDESCTVEGSAKCTQDGKRMVCRNGLYTTETCDPGTVCYQGECSTSCNADTYIVSCYDDTSRAVCVDGAIISEKCADGNICHKGHCRDASLESCDNFFVQKCRDESSFLTCQMGFVVNNPCAEGLVCDDGLCVKVDRCDSSTFAPSCISDFVYNSCDNGKEATHKCPEGQRCLGGSCTTACPDGFRYCSADGTKDYACENGQLTTHYCASGMMCQESGCPEVETCDSSTFKAVCTSDTMRKICDPILGIIQDAPCVNGQTCYKGICVSDAPCDLQTYTPVCDSTSTVKVCNASGSGFTTFEDCKTGEICENGICQSLTESCTTGAVECTSNSVKRECIDGIWHSSYCDISTQVCAAGACINKTDAVTCANSSEIKCEGNSLVKCENGYVAKYPCEEGKHCDLGKCYDNVTVGDACDAATFDQQCLDTEKVLICHDNVVTEISCGIQMCKAGACVDKSCESDSFKAECTEGAKYTACESGVIVEKTCDTNFHCADGVCKADANEGDPCNESTFVKACTTDGKLSECIDSKVTMTACAEDKPVCFSGACVACDPTNTVKDCSSDNVTRECNAAGEWVETTCTGEDVCYQGNCTECDPTKGTKLCTDNKLKTCNASGKFEESDCPEGYKCDNNECSDVCTSNEDCKVAHYVCKESKCTFEPECDVTEIPSCSDDGKSVKTCQTPGLYSETACAETEVCKNGKCIGNECDPDTYGMQCKSDNKTQLTCIGGYLKESECAGACKDGKCVDCIYGETPLSCKSTSVVIECTSTDTYKQYPCDENSECKDGKGCVSKCGEDFTNHCEENNRVFCNAGTTVSEPCDYRSTCEDGICKNRTNTPCVPVITDSTCHDNSGIPVLEYCDPASSKIQFTSCTGPHFCGELNGVTDCYSTCSASDVTNDVTWCVTWWDDKNYIGKCTSGTDYKGNATYGVYRNAAICDNDNSVSCRVDSMPGHNNHIVFDYLSCNRMGGSNCSTGSCGFASCSAEAASCSGNVATNCLYDPAYDNGSGGLVATSMNCSDVGGNCIVYNPDGVNRATCAVTDSVFNIGGLENQPVSSLGTCYGNVLYKLYWSSIASSHSYRMHTCKTECVTETAGSEQYAYCK